MGRKGLVNLAVTIGLAVMLLSGALGVWPARSAVPHLAYGFNTAEWDIMRMLDMGFDWIKLFHSSNPTSLPPQMNVLYRFMAQSSNLNDVTAFGAEVSAVAVAFGDVIDAYEIGNEVNIDNSDYGWGNDPVNAEDYKVLLCEAYTSIKQVDPTAIVVSAGLAPTGRVPGTWQDSQGHLHTGHNGSFQDDREFLKELLAAGGGACLDAVGYHPYGFLADYDVVPDVVNPGIDPLTDPRACPNGFCFRGAEKIYEIMQQQGLGGKKVWATEFGWITQPPDHCLSDPTWQGRQWQIVSDDKQASNLVGAYQYADAHWPWLGGLFIFNLNFNVAPWYSECEQMRYYGVQGKPAEGALAAMPKNKASLLGQLRAGTSLLSLLVDVDEQPITWTSSIALFNAGWQSLVYTATVESSAEVEPAMSGATAGLLSATQESLLHLSVPGFSRTLGTYTGTVSVDWYAAGAGNHPRIIRLQMIVISDVSRIFLPLLTR